MANSTQESSGGGLTPLWLLISWLWVGVPLAYGVYKVVKTSLTLFN